MKNIVLTGAAGFIGSSILHELNRRGYDRIIVVDNLSAADKFHNLSRAKFTDFFDKEDFRKRLLSGDFDGQIDAVLHQGACSDTMEQDGRYMMDNNYRYSIDLLNFCLKDSIPLIYASSAAVYGASKTFTEQPDYEQPLNIYGYSKLVFDQRVRSLLSQNQTKALIVGLRYFNVYGPHESHKGRMASVAFHHYNQWKKSKKVKLFVGSHGYTDGEQQRDFIYVDDVVKVNLALLEVAKQPKEQPHRLSGVYNLGTGNAQSFNQLSVALVNAARKRDNPDSKDLLREQMVAENILEYVKFPEGLKDRYQAFTQADVTQLKTLCDGTELALGMPHGSLRPTTTVEQGAVLYEAWLHQQSQEGAA